MSSTSKRSSSSSSGSSGSIFSLGCGCKDTKSVSVSDSVSDTFDKSIITHAPPPTREISIELPSPYFPSSPSPALLAQDPEDTPSFSGLLRELDDLEKTVLSLAPPNNPPPPPPQQEVEETEEEEEEEHEVSTRRRTTQPRRRTRSEGGGGGGRVLEESVAVVKETDDPLGDFRRSMLQMIVEKEIVGRDELRQLLKRFLALNSPRHHDVILRAFADIWNEVFSGLDGTGPDQLRRSRSTYYPPRRPTR